MTLIETAASRFGALMYASDKAFLAPNRTVRCEY
jgi:hypothetical protein